MVNSTKEPTLVFSRGTSTIRQYPENYLIAHKESGRWICEPDLACNKGLAIQVFTALLDYNAKYGSNASILRILNLKEV